MCNAYVSNIPSFSCCVCSFYLSYYYVYKMLSYIAKMMVYTASHMIEIRDEFSCFLNCFFAMFLASNDNFLFWYVLFVNFFILLCHLCYNSSKGGNRSGDNFAISFQEFTLLHKTIGACGGLYLMLAKALSNLELYYSMVTC